MLSKFTIQKDSKQRKINWGQSQKTAAVLASGNQSLDDTMSTQIFREIYQSSKSKELARKAVDYFDEQKRSLRVQEEIPQAIMTGPTTSKRFVLVNMESTRNKAYQMTIHKFTKQKNPEIKD